MKRWLPLGLIIILLMVAIYFRWYQYLSFESLQNHREQIVQWVEYHYLTAVLSFMAIYILSIAVSLPGALFLTLAGGFMFGPWLGTIYVVISATLGACILFLAVKTSLGEWLSHKAHGWVARMEKGFQQNAFSYLLSLRLIPIFPFWAINIAAALLNIRLRSFFFATLIGIIPGSFIYSLVGNGLGSAFNRNQQPDLSIIFQSQILIPLLLLAALSLLPVVYKKIKQRKNNHA